jgi:hypothetical protein
VGSSGNSASRIRYDVKNATPEDEFTCLLVFTRAGKDTIDRWMPTLRAGELPPRSFTSVSADMR